MLQGTSGNIAASVGEDGIVIVGDQYAPLADKIAAQGPLLDPLGHIWLVGKILE